MVEEMKALKLQSAVVYGPVESRRFGMSLGINLLPDRAKVCTFNCVYCQYGEDPVKLKFPPYSVIQKEIEEGLHQAMRAERTVNWIMLSGNGEPTLHPDFPRIVENLRKLRDRFLPRVPLGILSNASTCHREGIRRALCTLDGRFMKLDAGSLYLFHELNRPSSTLVWADVIAGLCRLPRVTLQSMFVAGSVDNTGENAVREWIDIVARLRPLGVQIYTVDRQPRQTGILPVDEEKLKTISNRLRVKTLIPSTVYT